MKQRIREYLPVALAVLCLFAARSSLADHYVVPSGSMEYTLLPGDRVLVDKHAYGWRVPFTLVKLGAGSPPARGDVVVFDSPVDGTRLIKRVAAVADDVIEVRGGHAWINGKPLATAPDDTERFDGRLATLNLGFGGGANLAPTRVPPGKVLVLGDARGNSHDSRYFGFVHADAIYAKAARVYFRRGQGFVWRPL